MESRHCGLAAGSTRNRDSALIENPRKRSVHTLISANAIVMTGQLKPQTKARSTSSSLALVISSNPCGEATNHLLRDELEARWRVRMQARCGTLVQSRPTNLLAKAGDLHKHKRARSKMGRWLPRRAPLIPPDAGSKLRCGGLRMASVSDSKVRVIARHTRLRTSESKGHWQSMILVRFWISSSYTNARP